MTPEGKNMRANLQRIVEKRGRAGKKKVRGDTHQGGGLHVNEINKSDGYVTLMSKRGRQCFQEK